jgi:hypothetical protein
MVNVPQQSALHACGNHFFFMKMLHGNCHISQGFWSSTGS